MMEWFLWLMFDPIGLIVYFLAMAHLALAGFLVTLRGGRDGRL